MAIQFFGNHLLSAFFFLGCIFLTSTNTTDTTTPDPGMASCSDSYLQNYIHQAIHQHSANTKVMAQFLYFYVKSYVPPCSQFSIFVTQLGVGSEWSTVAFPKESTQKLICLYKAEKWFISIVEVDNDTCSHSSCKKEDTKPIFEQLKGTSFVLNNRSPKTVDSVKTVQLPAGKIDRTCPDDDLRSFIEHAITNGAQLGAANIIDQVVSYVNKAYRDSNLCSKYFVQVVKVPIHPSISKRVDDVRYCGVNNTIWMVIVTSDTCDTPHNTTTTTSHITTTRPGGALVTTPQPNWPTKIITTPDPVIKSTVLDTTRTTTTIATKTTTTAITLSTIATKEATTAATNLPATQSSTAVTATTATISSTETTSILNAVTQVNEQFRTIWYFYITGGVILAAILIALAIFIIRRRDIKRDEKLRQIRNRMELVTTTVETNENSYERSSHLKDDWEISLKLIDINYVTVLGKGAFSVVHSGYLHGNAPILNMFPSIALQQFCDCEVAVKTLPQHSTESDKSKFRDEIHLMKEIGYNVHLVCMLGCNCSVERPILLMELAKQDLLHFLVITNASVTEIELNLEKTLLSISWQVSDGMSYLFSKNFIHCDLAARNVLLNSEMKAMVSDFGLCKKLEFADQVITIRGRKLPLKWMATESLQDRRFSLKTDVWSFGVLLFEIFSLGQEPYTQTTGEDLITFLCEGNRLTKPLLATEEISSLNSMKNDKIKKVSILLSYNKKIHLAKRYGALKLILEKFPSFCPRLYDLMNQCWNADPAKRPDFAKIQSYFEHLLKERVANYGYLETTEETNQEHF